MGVSNKRRIDALGLQDSPEDSQDDILAYEIFEWHVWKKEQRYEVPLLILEPGLDDSQNYALAKQRLLMQLRRFRERSDLLARYNDTIKDYFNESHAERVPNPDSLPKANTAGTIATNRSVANDPRALRRYVQSFSARGNIASPSLRFGKTIPRNCGMGTPSTSTIWWSARTTCRRLNEFLRKQGPFLQTPAWTF
ncbi:hypothetical protein HPB50_028487 [Hyalomma asiaticum]|nr:hypothetical protein HPB50_028487 [Hyalomma asiaticum]